MAFRFTPSVRLALAAFLAMMLATASARPMLASRAGPPSEDPFYDPPEGFENEAPGTILRQRTIDATFFKTIPNPVETHQLLYRTEAIDGAAVATVTTVFKPWFPMDDRWISFHTAYDSSSPKCSPSNIYRAGGETKNVIVAAEMLIIEAYLILGYVVASPDYEGPDAAFAAGHLEGCWYRLLGRRHRHGLGSSLHPHYAPDLNVHGWVQGGTPVNLTSTLLYIDGTAKSGFTPIAIDGLSKPSAYGERWMPLLNRIVTPQGETALEFAETHCATAVLDNFKGKSIFSPNFQSLGRDILENPVVSSVLSQNVMGVKRENAPTAPMFVYHTTQDNTIPYSDASQLVDRWCGYGSDVQFTTFRAGSHSVTEVFGIPYVMDFIDNAFDGKVPSGCSREGAVASFFDLLSLDSSLADVIKALIELFVSAGQDDDTILQDLKDFVNAIF
ncbi:secretory lipase [Aspergillus sp. HF37]|nr:secretory lipase [Aspergillus sp. HF37]